MKIEICNYDSAATKVCLTHEEVVNLFYNMGEEDVNIVLGYEDSDYMKPYAEYGSKEGRRRCSLLD